MLMPRNGGPSGTLTDFLEWSDLVAVHDCSTRSMRGVRMQVQQLIRLVLHKTSHARIRTLIAKHCQGIDSVVLNDANSDEWHVHVLRKFAPTLRTVVFDAPETPSALQVMTLVNCTELRTLVFTPLCIEPERLTTNGPGISTRLRRDVDLWGALDIALDHATSVTELRLLAPSFAQRAAFKVTIPSSVQRFSAFVWTDTWETHAFDLSGVTSLEIVVCTERQWTPALVARLAQYLAPCKATLQELSVRLTQRPYGACPMTTCERAIPTDVAPLLRRVRVLVPRVVRTEALRYSDLAVAQVTPGALDLLPTEYQVYQGVQELHATVPAHRAAFIMKHSADTLRELVSEMWSTTHPVSAAGADDQKLLHTKRAPRLPLLTRCTLTQPVWASTTTRFLARCPALHTASFCIATVGETLAERYSQTRAALSQFPQLRHVELFLHRVVTPAGHADDAGDEEPLPEKYRDCSHLHSLTLVGPWSVTQLFADTTMPNLQQLSLFNVVTPASLHEVMIRVPRLRLLECDDVPTLEDFFASPAVGDTWRELDTLMLNQCPLVDSKSIVRLLRNTPRIRVLSIRYCEGITDLLFASLIALKLPRLNVNRLDTTGCMVATTTPYAEALKQLYRKLR